MKMKLAGPKIDRSLLFIPLGKEGRIGGAIKVKTGITFPVTVLFLFLKERGLARPAHSRYKDLTGHWIHLGEGILHEGTCIIAGECILIAGDVGDSTAEGATNFQIDHVKTSLAIVRVATHVGVKAHFEVVPILIVVGLESLIIEVTAVLILVIAIIHFELIHLAIPPSLSYTLIISYG
jgi:hypothetical protein